MNNEQSTDTTTDENEGLSEARRLLIKELSMLPQAVGADIETNNNHPGMIGVTLGTMVQATRIEEEETLEGDGAVEYMVATMRQQIAESLQALAKELLGVHVNRKDVEVSVEEFEEGTVYHILGEDPPPEEPEDPTPAEEPES